MTVQTVPTGALPPLFLQAGETVVEVAEDVFEVAVCLPRGVARDGVQGVFASGGGASECHGFTRSQQSASLECALGAEKGQFYATQGLRGRVGVADPT